MTYKKPCMEIFEWDSTEVLVSVSGGMTDEGSTTGDDVNKDGFL